MQPQTILNEFGKPVQFGYAGSRPSWRKHEDALDRSSIVQTEEKVLSHGNRLELLSTLRDLERNNPICKSIIQVFVSNLGSCKYQAMGSNEELNEEQNKLFKNYFRNCEISGHGMQKVLQHIITDLLLAGEAFVLLTKGGSFQLVPSERVASSHDPQKRKQNEVDGIVLNQFGRPTQYRVANIKDGVVDYSEGIYINSKDCIHVANTTRIGQIRGTPLLAAATKTLEDIHEVQTAYTAKVKTSSALTGFITSNQPYSARWDGNEFGDEPMRSSYKKLYSGSLLLLEAGESVETIQGGAVDGVDKFMLSLISFACSSVGITVENLVGWSNASFSSSKATRAVTNHRFGQIREQIEDIFLRRLCKWKMYKWENNGEINGISEADRENFDFMWTTSPTLDRRQDAQTDAVLLENGLASKSTIYAANGMDYEEELKKMAKDRAMEKALQGDVAPVTEQASIKEKIDAYGVGVRAGSITPQIEDENYFREQLGLEAIKEPVMDAWRTDGGTRRPITLKSQEGFEEQEGIDQEPTDAPEQDGELTEEEQEALEFATYNDYPKSASNNAKKALKYRNENNPDCGTPVGWARANQLAKGENISRDTIARMASFKRHQQHKDVPYSEGCGGLMWDAWGGTSGIEWAIRKLKEIDNA